MSTMTHEIATDDGQVGSYVTDGRHLYRLLGAVAGGGDQLFGLEDCRTLDIALLTAAELRRRRLRPVAAQAAAA